MTVEAPYQDPDDTDTPADDPGPMFWTVEDIGDDLWHLAIYTVAADGAEHLVATVPLTPADAVELDGALDSAYRSMTGEALPTQQTESTFRWLDRSTWNSSHYFRFAVLALFGLLAIVALVINIADAF